MALALPPPSSAMVRLMPPVRSSSIKASSPPDCSIVISIEAPPSAKRRDSYTLAYSPASLSPAESDEPPLSPMVFHPNEEFEKQRLSYIEPQPRAASSPSSPNEDAPSSPVLFAHPNLSSPTLVLPPLPVFPFSTSLATRIKRPLPRLDSHPAGDTAAETASRQALPSVRPKCGRVSPSGSDVADNDSVTAFSPSPSPSPSSPSSSTSIYTTASEPPDSARAVDGFSRTVSKPRPLALTIPARSHSAPLLQSDPEMVAPFADRFVSPYISVTPASPLPPKPLPPVKAGGKKKKTRTASATSIVIPSDAEDDLEPRSRPPPLTRSTSPAPSLTPSVSSTKSSTKQKSTLKRIASRTGLFGRRARTSSDPWADDDDDTVIGHGSHSLDDPTMRLRGSSSGPASPRGSCEHAGAGAKMYADAVPRAMRRVEVAEVTLTPHGDIWEMRDVEDVIPKLRQLRAPTKIRL